MVFCWKELSLVVSHLNSIWKLSEYFHYQFTEFEWKIRWSLFLMKFCIFICWNRLRMCFVSWKSAFEKYSLLYIASNRSHLKDRKKHIRRKKENSNEPRICTSVFYWIRNFMKRWATTTKIPQMTKNIKIIWRYTLNKNSHHWICYMEQYNGGCYIEMFAFQKWYRHRISYLI